MMTPKKFLAAALAAAALFIAATTVLPAQEIALQFDPNQTQVEYTLGDVLHSVHGNFKLEHGSIHFDPATGLAGGNVVIDASSGNSGSKSRDRKMNKDILESQKYPEIVFAPDRVEGQIPTSGDFQIQVHGLFGLHGTQHEMTLLVQGRRAADNFVITTEFVVPYVEWGLKNPSNFLLRVSDKVGIKIQATASMTSLGELSR